MPQPITRETLRAYLRQIVYGANDGIITTFAIVLGFAGAELDGGAGLGAIAVLVFGLANLTADAVSMGLGEFLSGQASRDLYATRKAEALAAAKADPEAAVARLARGLADQGLAAETAGHTAAHIKDSPELMADLILRFDYGMEAPESGHLGKRALITFLSFVAFGAIPIAPFVLGPGDAGTLYASVAATVLALILLGTLRWSVTAERLTRAIGSTLAVGVVCAAVAYGAGRLVAGLG